MLKVSGCSDVVDASRMMRPKAALQPLLGYLFKAQTSAKLKTFMGDR